MTNRNNNFLKTRLRFLWNTYFPDIKQKNPVNIVFGRNAKTRLGSISYSKKNQQTTITINGLYRMKRIPVCIVDSTIAHELVHYAHGFQSPHKQLYSYPHQGGILLREFKNRNLFQLHLESKRWLKNNWKFITDKYIQPHAHRHHRKYKKKPNLFITWLFNR